MAILSLKVDSITVVECIFEMVKSAEIGRRVVQNYESEVRSALPLLMQRGVMQLLSSSILGCHALPPVAKCPANVGSITYLPQLILLRSTLPRGYS